jgi:hypothetical protein
MKKERTSLLERLIKRALCAKKTRRWNNIFFLSPDKTRFLSAAGFISIILLVTTVFPVGFVFAQSGYWDITMQYNVTATENESGAAISVSMSGNSILHLPLLTSKFQAQETETSQFPYMGASIVKAVLEPYQLPE